jgi:hypothetical protein
LVVARCPIKHLVCLGIIGNESGCGYGDELGFYHSNLSDEYHALLFIKDAKGFQCLDINFFSCVSFAYILIELKWFLCL